MSPAAHRSNRPATSRSKSKTGPRLTCVSCRSKKIRCDGALPGCGICAAYGKDCSYEKPPPMSQVIAMTERIKELERTIRELSNSLGQEVSGITATSLAQPEDNQMISHSDSEDQSISLHHHDPYYESTSAVDAPRDVPSVEAGSTTQLSLQPTRQSDFHEPSMELNWEESAIANCAMFLQLPPDKIRHLLATHWTWVHPTFMFVNRSMFLQDAAVGGEFFSPLLLTVICLHSTRFTGHELNERLFSFAKMLIGHEIHDAPTIPRTQAFLQLSAREIGRGSISQAWLYSGIAFRMALDMGLFVANSQESSTLERTKKQQLGRKLAWSCYLWDKAMSLYLGRSPSLQTAPAGLPDDLQSSRDKDDWSPYGVAGSSPAYRTAPSCAEACFQNFCTLGVIICDILLNLYGQHSTQNASLFVSSTRDRLEGWYQNLPPNLRMGASPVVCPSPHILTQNLLYRATTILLLRPFRKVSACRAGCREAANAIENLFLCVERTFGLTRVTYLMAYCAYIAATVAVQDAKDHISGAQHRVETFVRVLSATRYSCPGIQRSLDIIKQSMSLPIAEVVTQPEASQPPIPDPIFDVFNSMPTFPLNCSVPGFNTSTGMTTSAETVLMPFTELDPFSYQWSNFQEEMFDGMSFDL